MNYDKAGFIDRSDAAQQAVKDTVAAFVAERSYNQPQAAPTRAPVRPMHLSEGQLAIARQQAGIKINTGIKS